MRSMSQRAVKREAKELADSERIVKLMKERDSARKIAIQHGIMVNAMEKHIAALEAVAEAARVIFEVTDGASIQTKAKSCPHGNQPHYPTHAWWCDDCWNALRDALKEAEHD